MSPFFSPSQVLVRGKLPAAWPGRVSSQPLRFFFFLEVTVLKGTLAHV